MERRQQPITAWLCGCVCLLAFAGQLPAADEAQIRDLLKARLTFKAYVFGDDAFPAGAFEPAAVIEKALGPCTFRTTYYDADCQRVETAKKPGPYAAIVEAVPQKGSPLRRYATLYRTAEPIKGTQRWQPEDAAVFARQLGLDSAVARQESQLIAETLKGRAFDELARDPRVAKLLTGLHQQKAGTSPARKNEDAFSLERQWWVGLKRKLLGLDKVYAKPFLCPQPIKGQPAPVVRAGTLAEAGMKADAADKIDAACQAFAADTDQAFAVCIVRRGVIVLHKAYGMRDGKPMTLTTKSWMASITKAMSATLMMMLVDQGLVNLDDPVDKFLPALRDIKVEKPLTIRHLYTHTNGLDKWPGWHDDFADLEEHVANYYPLLKVGQAWAYNGTGYELGGKIIEAVSGEAVPLFFQHHLLGPLGNTDTDVLGTHADAFSVPLDTARFGQLLLNRGAYGKLRFFREETFQKMLPQKLTMILGPDATKTFGIGLDGTPERFGHGAASAATFHVDTTEELVVIMTRNRQGKNQDKYNGKIWAAIREGIDKTAAKPGK